MQFHRQITWQIPIATSSASLLITFACQAIDMFYKEGFKYHKCGIIAVDIIPKEQVQSSLWDSDGNVINGNG